MKLYEFPHEPISIWYNWNNNKYQQLQIAIAISIFYAHFFFLRSNFSLKALVMYVYESADTVTLSFNYLIIIEMVKVDRQHHFIWCFRAAILSILPSFIAPTLTRTECCCLRLHSLILIIADDTMNAHKFGIFKCLVHIFNSRCWFCFVFLSFSIYEEGKIIRL